MLVAGYLAFPDLSDRLLPGDNFVLAALDLGHRLVIAANVLHLVLELQQPLVLFYVEDHPDALAVLVGQVARFYKGRLT